MTESKGREFCLVVEGAYLTESEAEHALRDPFIEDWVEQTGHFKIHNMDDIQVTAGVTLGSLGVVMIDERLFERLWTLSRRGLGANTNYMKYLQRCIRTGNKP